jgi:hypothetical protein
MWNTRLNLLFQEFCTLAGTKSLLEEILKNGNLQVDGILFTCMPSLKNDSDLRIFTQFGQAPKARLLAIYRRLLELNVLLPQGAGERLGVDPDTGAVIFIFELSSPSAEQLLHSVRRASLQAQAWRRDFFLDDDAVAPQPTEYAVSI